LYGIRREHFLFLAAVLLIATLAVAGAAMVVVQPPPIAAPTVTPLPTYTARPTYTPRPTFSPSASLGTPTTEPIPSPSPSSSATPTNIPTATPSPTVAPTPLPVGTPASPAVLGRLIIPKLKVDTTILPIPILNGDWDMKRIVMEAGWLAGTAPVGGPGNTGIAGHVSLKCCGDGPFRWLERLAPGDEVVVQTFERTYRYIVVETRVVDPTEVGVMGPTADPQLTLVTCNDWDYSKSEFVKRLIVIAR
jgi:sortase A